MALFVAGFCILILVLISKERQTIVGEAERSARRLVDLLAMHFQSKVDSGQQLLELLAANDKVMGDDVATCHELLKKTVADHPEYTGILVAEADGTVFCRDSDESSITSIEDRDFYRLPVERGEFSVGSYQIGRVSKKALMSVGLPVLDENGEIIRVIAAGLDLSLLHNLLTLVSLPEGVVILELDVNGTIVSHYPNNEDYVGTTIVDNGLLQAMLSKGQGAVVAAHDDGVERNWIFDIVSRDSERVLYLAVGVTEDVVIRSVAPYLADDNVRRGFYLALTASLGYVFVYLTVAAVYKIRQLERQKKKKK